jgi:hypothetical protein
MSWVGRFAVLWGIGGAVMVLLEPIARLSLQVLAALRDPALTWWQLLGAGVWTGVMAVSEGYRAFQLGFSPRIVVRAFHLGRHPTWWGVLLAPMFAIGLLHATRRRLITSWLLVVFIRVLVEVVRQVEQPWRGLIDLGVVVGLAWGLVALLVFAARAALTGKLPAVDGDLPAAP